MNQPVVTPVIPVSPWCVLGVGGRLSFSSLSFGFKYPVSAVCVLLSLSYQWQFGVKQLFVFSYF